MAAGVSEIANAAASTATDSTHVDNDPGHTQHHNDVGATLADLITGRVLLDTTNAPKRLSPTPVIGSASGASPSDHQHPRAFWTPSDQGLVSYTYDPATVSGNATLASAGVLYLSRLHVDVAATVTNILASIATAGATLTAGQCGAALYNASGALLSATADQASAWGSTGLKTMALAVAQNLPAGDYYVGLWFNGTTSPAFYRQGTGAHINAGLAATASRFGTANTGVTTAAPNTLGTIAAATNAWWIGLS
jgi:hypothetical protein